ncbi:MAG TPA: ParB N-terminal domain-containing protein [Nitrososphaera sp.]
MKSSSISGKSEREETKKATKANSGSSGSSGSASSGNNGTAHTHTLPLSQLLPSPVRVRLHTTQFIDSITASIEADLPIEGIAVARVGNKYYIVDGHARVDAYRAAGLAEVVVSDELVLDDVAQVVIEHVKRNITSPLNPLNVANAIAFLAKHGIKDPYAAIPLGEVMKRAVQLILGVYDTELRATLQKYLLEKAAIFPDVEVLPHFFIAVYETCSSDIPSSIMDDRKRKEEIQRRMRALVQSILGYLNMLRAQERFVFPTPDQVMAMAASLKQKRTLEYMMALQSSSSSAAVQRTTTTAAAAGGRAVMKYGGSDTNDDGDDDNGSGEIGSHPSIGATPGKKGANGVLLPDNNKSLIHCLHCGKQQVVDMSTGAVCRIEEFGPVNVIRGDGDGSNDSQVFCLSPKHVEFLGLASGTVDVDDVKQLVTDRKSEVEKFLKRVSIATRFVVIAVDHEV